ncbi:MarR family winged helix-turn-helix transcriptional regulator [Neorhizobium galegae]|uniref:MarR family winged helix-turn-helix transcriptional regulator n=1 Tax=Neorhizobium galegae TaxID=399 RepID=UPI00062109A3|nr:MarR family winged helix-turn-helix transcriptional regulator [Neorhizobium galegae]CDZ29516.1 Transcriptional regulator [Neorhizobium galegae bv. officinalis]KAA9386270.1 winged helix-turn-helix transcriptional regulator [Neorhizobium galegae]KAB1112873.1 winged helix-turn-helix transcriptional regulator [Neorhizobium galegae]MCM2500671.1 MarR family transcriptional regulator [Neorhizobium galegae]MCQ1770630.1 MarR family transcriptional regulator [Neorhizobium galegae]
MTTKSLLQEKPAAPSPSPEDVARVSETLGRMRILIGRRIIGRTAIANIAPGLEISHLDVLDVMRRIEGEVTVGAIAEAMRIDPSRGSRLVADLVARGILRRDASQADGRRSLVVRTEFGDSLLAEIRAVKRTLLARILEDWPEDELNAFSVLFEKFVSSFEEIYVTSEKPPEGELSEAPQPMA